MSELIWMREDEGQAEYTEHGRYRAVIARIEEPADGRTTIRYSVRDMDSGLDEKASYLQVPQGRADAVVESVKAKLEADLLVRGGPLDAPADP